MLPVVQGLQADLGGIDFSIIDAIAIPYTAIASRRFLDAARLVLGHRLPGPPQIALADELPLEEALALKAETIKYVRSASSQLERIAYGVDEPIGYVCWKGKSQFIYLTIAGGRERIDLLEGEASLPTGRTHIFSEMAQRAALMPSERIRDISRVIGGNSTSSNPVVEILSQLQQTAYRFNRVGERHEVIVSPDELKREISEALQRRSSDARHLAQLMGVPFDNLDSLAPHKYYLVVIPIRLGTYIQPGTSLARFWREPLERGDADQIEVHVAPAREKEATLEILDDTVREIFGIDPDITSYTGQYVDSTIALLLGIDAEHIYLHFADDA